MATAPLDQAYWDRVRSLDDLQALPLKPRAREVVEAAQEYGSLGEGRKVVGTLSLFRAVIDRGRRRRSDDVTSPTRLYDWLARNIDENSIDTWLSAARSGKSEAAGSVALTAQAIGVLKRAEDFSRQTGQNEIQTRHLVAALIVPGSPAIDRTIIYHANRELLIDIRNFVPALFSYIIEQRLSDEITNSWKEILVEHLQIPDYAADRPDNVKDAINVTPDAEALAQLICFKGAKPPLSIGLFGDWGSGKTFFMEQLQKSVNGIAERARSARRSPDYPFVSDIVQIRFNAWHYADAEIWACLTAEFFDQLRMANRSQADTPQYEALVSKVGAHLRTLETAVKQNTSKAGDLEQEMKQTKAQITETRATLDGTLRRSGDIGLALQRVFGEQFERLRVWGSDFDAGEQKKRLQQFANAAQEARDTAGKLRLLYNALWLGNAPKYILLAVLLFILLGVYIWYADELSAWISLVALAPIAAALFQAWQYVKPFIHGAAALAQDLEEKRRDLNTKLIEQEAELLTLTSRQRDNADALLAANEQLELYGRSWMGGSQPALLRYFLFEDDSTKEYAKHLGLVSRARHSFETLDRIVSQARLARIAAVPQTGPAEDRSSTGSKDNQPAVAGADEIAEQEALAILGVPDRIVIYVDDLDRCTQQQVYNVLQAMHLLLAFELFVVVVGVDVRWIHGAVSKHFEGDVLFGGGAREPQSGGAGKEPRTDQNDGQDVAAASDARLGTAGRNKAGENGGGDSRSINYLEKIFQIPFWLRPLSVEAKANTYRDFVESLLQKNSLKTRTEPVGETGGKQTENNASGDTGPDSNGPERPPEETLAEAEDVPRILLSEKEADFLGSDTIGRLVGGSPRTVKRFVNLYRLVRARHKGPKLAAITGESRAAPSYPILAFMVALETGQPSELVTDFYRALGELKDGDVVSQAKAFAKPGRAAASSDQPSSGIERIYDLASGLRDADTERGAPALASEYKQYKDDVRRYSFHRLEKEIG